MTDPHDRMDNALKNIRRAAQQLEVRTPRQNKKFKQMQFNACATGVNPIRTHGLGVWGNAREVVGIRIDKKLYATAKPILIDVFGSVCRPIESFLATVVSTYNSKTLDFTSGVNPRNTIEIGQLVIQRNVRSRRKLVVEEETEVSYAHKIICSYCSEPATWEVTPKSGVAESVVYACDVHYDDLKDRRMIADSKPISYVKEVV